MNLWGDIVGAVIKPIGAIIDSVTTTDEERSQAKARLMAIQNDLAEKVIAYERTLAEEQGRTIRAEATGHSWLQRNWRPITMLMFAYIIFHSYVLQPVFGVPAVVMSERLWDLMSIGLGGYVIGRSAEKIAPQVVSSLKSSK